MVKNTIAWVILSGEGVFSGGPVGLKLPISVRVLGRIEVCSYLYCENKAPSLACSGSLMALLVEASDSLYVQRSGV